MKRETTCQTRAQRLPKRHLRHLLGVLLVITLIIAQTGCAANEKTNDNQGISKTGFYLDTICTITIFGIEDADGSFAAADEEEQQRQLYQLITDAFKLCDSYEKILSKTIKTSDIARVNAASGKAVEVSDATIEVLRKGIEYGQLSNGAFDITIGKATDLWNFHDAGDTALAAEGSGESAADKVVEGEVAAGEAMPGEIPNAQVLAEAMRHVDYSKVEIDGNTVRLADPKMELDLGGIAKGYIADRVTAFLEEKGVRSAIVDLGGNIVALGGKARSMLDTEAGETDFRIGIKRSAVRERRVARHTACIESDGGDFGYL
ncbi:MAG: FAD:protein FMN transferase [Clostridia bacterium]